MLNSDTKSIAKKKLALVSSRMCIVALGEIERDLGDSRRALACDLADRKRKIGRRHEFARARMHRAVGIEAFRVLAHDHEVDRRAAARRKAAARTRRSDVGIEVEPLA